ncbi:hypothetical protein [Streptomyces hygroscopicus]|uniref:hypothetical protein n=1 Tax=Streptomyces hygroscopicus TaxID=1912 RepID=UPI001FCAE575|nr:hypothetical protein [Streptomyces hygroscopicus]BDH16197.1 hypothetical protein HOK021_73760 [Streptomyces hygroscopicus]
MSDAAESPAPADSPGRGGRVMPDRNVIPVPETTDDWTTPEGPAKYRSECGQSCTFVPNEKIGDPTYSGRKMVGTPTQNCSSSKDATAPCSNAETTSQTTTIGVTIGSIPAVTPKLDASWMKSHTETMGITGTIGPFQTGWYEEYTVTQKANWTWKTRAFWLGADCEICNR